MPTQEEFDFFDRISDQLDELSVNDVIRWCGIITKDGVRDYLVYCQDRETAASSLAGIGASIEFVFDPFWRQFKDFAGMIKGAKRLDRRPR